MNIFSSVDENDELVIWKESDNPNFPLVVMLERSKLGGIWEKLVEAANSGSKPAMWCKSSTKGATVKTVNVTGYDQSVTDAAIVAYAMKVTGEDKSSLFGWNVTRYANSAIVTLHTD